MDYELLKAMKEKLITTGHAQYKSNMNRNYMCL